ncbi:MAG: transglutaminase-like cysteine peptidase [Gammaproteobacteria bacterium]|nr:transglutaminase-like cysteine peptidase [Gammaproteobacteria bacterium]
MSRSYLLIHITIFSLVLLLIAAYQVLAEQEVLVDAKVIERVAKKFGPDAVDRINLLQELIKNDDSKTDNEKLEKVNKFYNQYAFVDDIDHWGEKDYWATPIEFIATEGGDCEDFSLAKYFTLKALGVPEKKLYLTYVKAIKLNQAHMVLTYYSTPDSEPLVLDNLNDTIQTASKRTDLVPVYTFNADGLWLAKQRGKGKFVGDSNRLKRWNDLKSRMATGL